MDCSGKWWSHLPWKCSNPTWMWHLRPWLSAACAGVTGLAAGPDDFKVLSSLNDSVTLPVPSAGSHCLSVPSLPSGHCNNESRTRFQAQTALICALNRI